MQLLLFALLMQIGALPDEEQAANLVTIEATVMRISLTDAMPLLPQLHDPDLSEKALLQIDSLVARGKGTVVGVPVLATRSGRLASAMTAEEIRHSTEMDPHSMHQNFSVPRFPPAVPPGGWRIPPTVYWVPVNFETRNVGVALQCEPKISAGSIELAVSLSHTELLGFRRFALGKERAGLAKFHFEPAFRVVETASTILVANGTRTLLGVHLLGTPASTVEIHTLRATLTAR